MWREKKFLGARDDEKFGRDWRLGSGDKWSWPQVRKTMIWRGPTPKESGTEEGGKDKFYPTNARRRGRGHFGTTICFQILKVEPPKLQCLSLSL